MSNKVLWGSIRKQLESYQTSQISDDHQVINYKEMIERIESLGDNLGGVSPFKIKCVILCKSGLNTALSILSCWKADIVPVPLSGNYGEKQCMKIIQIVKPDLIITDNMDYEIFNGSDIPIYSVIEKKLYGVVQRSLHDESLEDVAVIMFTSGTTGSPKGAMLTPKGLITNVQDISLYFNINSSDKILIARPLYHSAVLTGELLLSIYKGVNIHFLDSAYSPSSILSNIKTHHISILCGTPTLFTHISIYAKRKNIEPNIKAIVISGECLLSESAKKIREVFKKASIYTVYGLTEASPRVSYLEPELFDTYPESVGKPLASVEVKIVDNNGSEVEANIDGHLIVKGINVMKGYFGNISLDVIHDGWLVTGDIAYKDQNGLLYIKSRADDLIIKGGMNIYPMEIENTLKQEECIEDVLAYRIKKDLGFRIGLTVVMSEDYKHFSERDIMKICSKKLPAYQLPDYIKIVDIMEKTASGKIVRPRSNSEYSQMLSI